MEPLSRDSYGKMFEQKPCVFSDTDVTLTESDTTKVTSTENGKNDKSRSIAKKIFNRSPSFTKKPKVILNIQIPKTGEESLVNKKTNSSFVSHTQSQSGSLSPVLDEAGSEKKVIDKEENALACVGTVQEQFDKIQLQQLLERIKTNRKNLDSFFLAGELIISSKKLFSFIHSAIEQSAVEEIKFWQSFCLMWLNINKGSLLVENAQKEIEAIINFTAGHQDGNIKVTSELLKNTLKKALKQPGFIVNLSDKPLSFTMHIKRVVHDYMLSTQGLGKHPQKNIDIIARELLNFQCDLYRHVRPSDFLGKVCNHQPTALDKWIDYGNVIYEYVIDLILAEKDPYKRVSLIKVFIEVALKCLDLNDFQSPANISMALLIEISNLCPNTYKMVTKSSIYEKALRSFNDLYTGRSNYKELRMLIEKASLSGKLYIPFIGIYQKDLDMMQEKKAFTDDEPIYDIDRIDGTSTTIGACLKGQVQFNNQNNFIYETDFITKNLTKYKLKMDADKEAKKDRNIEREKIAKELND